jgi:hypothetical protein
MGHKWLMDHIDLHRYASETLTRSHDRFVQCLFVGGPNPRSVCPVMANLALTSPWFDRCPVRTNLALARILWPPTGQTGSPEENIPCSHSFRKQRFHPGTTEDQESKHVNFKTPTRPPRSPKGRGGPVRPRDTCSRYSGVSQYTWG